MPWPQWNETMKRLSLPVAILCGSLSLLPSAHGTSAIEAEMDLGFEAAFPRPFYQKKYFGLAVTGASIVAAGTFTYFTGGAGAPAAATGVSTVASWVAGGGAGSYMAGLSTIGGWFGGNAILGAAILNGISLGTIGGPAAFATLTAGQKAIVMTSIAATALDGVAIVGKPGTQVLEFQVTLPVPRKLADKRVGSLIDELVETNAELATLSSDFNAARAETAAANRRPGSAPSVNELKLEQGLEAQGAARRKIDQQIMNEVDRALKQGGTNRNLVVLAVLAHNLGSPDKFRLLLRRIDAASLKFTSYYDYLRAVAALQVEDFPGAEGLLFKSWDRARFAIEPPVLLVSLLGATNFAAKEARISEIASRAHKGFDDDIYAPRGSLVSLHYRIGTQALRAKRCERALYDFTQAQDALSPIEKYISGKDMRDLLNVAQANALYCLGKRADADNLFASVRKSAKDKDAVALVCAQYSGGCK